jgi:hypothetical protein
MRFDDREPAGLPDDDLYDFDDDLDDLAHDEDIDDEDIDDEDIDDEDIDDEDIDDEDIDDEDIDDEDIDDASDSMYLRYCFEGAASLAELVAALRLLADDIERRRREGWRLSDPVDGGWAHLVRDA